MRTNGVYEFDAEHKSSLPTCGERVRVRGLNDLPRVVLFAFMPLTRSPSLRLAPVLSPLSWGEGVNEMKGKSLNCKKKPRR
jgi:hypothetical protein